MDFLPPPLLPPCPACGARAGYVSPGALQVFAEASIALPVGVGPDGFLAGPVKVRPQDLAEEAKALFKRLRTGNVRPTDTQVRTLPVNVAYCASCGAATYDSRILNALWTASTHAIQARAVAWDLEPQRPALPTLPEDPQKAAEVLVAEYLKNQSATLLARSWLAPTTGLEVAFVTRTEAKADDGNASKGSSDPSSKIPPKTTLCLVKGFIKGKEPEQASWMPAAKEALKAACADWLADNPEDALSGDIFIITVEDPELGPPDPTSAHIRHLSGVVRPRAALMEGPTASPKESVGLGVSDPKDPKERKANDAWAEFQPKSLLHSPNDLSRPVAEPAPKQPRRL